MISFDKKQSISKGKVTSVCVTTVKISTRQVDELVLSDSVCKWNSLLAFKSKKFNHSKNSKSMKNWIFLLGIVFSWNFFFNITTWQRRPSTELTEFIYSIQTIPIRIFCKHISNVISRFWKPIGFEIIF